MALCQTNVASSGFSLSGQRRQHDHHSTKVCLDERLVFLHRTTDPVAPGWKMISISYFVPRMEGHPIFRGVVLHHSLRMKGHHNLSQEWAGLARLSTFWLRTTALAPR